MKRVIEVDEDRYDLLQQMKEALHGTGYMNYFEETIANSTPLNEVLDKIIEEIRCRMRMYKASDFKPNRMKVYALSDVIDIINKYKESEVK